VTDEFYPSSDNLFHAPNCSKTLDVTVTKVEHYLKSGLSPEAHDRYFSYLLELPVMM
jgi:hypothetical protein